MAERSPYEIAKETLKLLSVRKLLPSPENYQALYHEVAGTRHVPNFPEEQLRSIARVMPGQTPAQQRLLGQLDQAIQTRNWVSLQAALVGLATQPLVSTPAHLPDKPVVTDDLMAELREQIDKVLAVAEDVIVVDQGFEQLAEHGLSCAKVLVPGLLPMTFGHQYRRVSLARLDKAARHAQAKPVMSLADINPFPHNFP